MKKRWLILTALGFSAVTGGYTQTVTFDFDSAPAHISLPMDLMSGGISGHFSADPGYYNYSIQPLPVVGIWPAGFSGNCIWPNTIYRCDLLVAFDRALSDGSIMYSPDELATDSSCTMRITAYYGSRFVGTNTYSIDPPGTYPTGVLSITTLEPFTKLVIHYDKPPATGGDYGVIFWADNLQITPWSAPYARIDSLSPIYADHMLITGVTVPFGSPTIKATGALTQQFEFLGTATAAGDGSFQFEDLNAPSFTARFYRVTYP